MSNPNITGIILAGGKSSRMGTDKGLIPFKGKALIHYAEEILKTFCGQIIISSNSSNYDFLGYPVVKDIYPNSGPMGGIYSALCHSKTDLNIVISCDMPFINEGLIKDLISSADKYDVVVPWYKDDHFEPMAAAYQKKNSEIFLSFIKDNNYRIPDFYNVVNTLKLDMSQNPDYYSENLFYNINSKAELNKAENDK